MRLTPQFPSQVLEFQVRVRKATGGVYLFTDLPAGVYAAALEYDDQSGFSYGPRFLTSETIEISGDIARDFTLPE